jgi:integrative and conjugative element protein (TIGR02256 family)
MRDVAAVAHPLEAGGILVGVYSESTPWVTHALQIPSLDVGPAHYVVPAGITRRLVKCARQIDSRIGYLGEWHVHPDDVGPSLTDLRTMRKVGRAQEEPRPLLIVVRRTSDDHVLDARQLVWGQLRKLEIVLCGGLESIDSEPPDPNPTS